LNVTELIFFNNPKANENPLFFFFFARTRVMLTSRLAYKTSSLEHSVVCHASKSKIYINCM